MYNLYEKFPKHLKTAIYKMFLKEGKMLKTKTGQQISICPKKCEKMIFEFIKEFFPNAICEYYGDNTYSFDILIKMNKEIIAISIKTIQKGNFSTKEYEMSKLQEELNKLMKEDKHSIKIIDLISDNHNNRLEKENIEFGITQRITLFFEKNVDEVLVKESQMDFIDKTKIKDIKFTEKQVSFSYNNERCVFRYSNNTLKMTRKNAKIVDRYKYNQGLIKTLEDSINEIINETYSECEPDENENKIVPFNMNNKIISLITKIQLDKIKK